jgi:hypothetical protein
VTLTTPITVVRPGAGSPVTTGIVFIAVILVS